MRFIQRRREAERPLVDGVAEEKTTVARPLVRDTALFMGWGPKLW